MPGESEGRGHVPEVAGAQRREAVRVPGSLNIIISSSAEETIGFGRKIAADLQGGEVIALNGPLGAGKTTLIKGIAEGLGVADTSDVRSPTFVLLRTYEGKTSAGKPISIHHMDAYRLQGGGDFDDLGGLDLLGDDTVLIIEWADRVASGLPENRIHVTMEHIDPETRKITVRR